MPRPSGTFARTRIMNGLLLMLLSVIISPVIDIFAKLAISTISPTQVSAARFLLQALFALPMLFWQGNFGKLSLRQSGAHALRGGVLTVSMISFVTTLTVMEVADAIAIFFVEPIILTILSSLFLKETIGWRRYSACGVGFLGALLIIQPSFQEVGWIALLPVVSALAIAIYVILTRLLAHREDAWSMQFQTGLWGLAFCSLILLVGQTLGAEDFMPSLPDVRATLYLLGVGLSASLAGILGVYAYRAAPPSILAPLQYFEIISATGLAWMVFGDFPDGLKWLGIAIIIASGLYIIWRERRFASKPVSNAEPAPPTP